jgi:hypothetical protein
MHGLLHVRHHDHHYLSSVIAANHAVLLPTAGLRGAMQAYMIMMALHTLSLSKIHALTYCILFSITQ